MEQENRRIPLVAPFGIHYLPKEGDPLLLLPVEGAQVGIGIRFVPQNLAPGELELCSAGGARIHLKNNGSIVINGLTITRDGKILPK